MMEQFADVTGVILAGGKSRRMGRDKATLAVGGESLFSRIETVLGRCFSRRLIAGERPDLAGVDLPCYPDLYPGSALGGLYTGLYHSATPYVFVAPCDLAAPQEAVIRTLVGERHGYDAVVIRTEAGWEPLFAVYAKSILPVLRQRLERNELSIQQFLDTLRVRAVGGSELPPGWEAGLRNLNTPEDLRAMRASAQADDEE